MEHQRSDLAGRASSRGLEDGANIPDLEDVFWVATPGNDQHGLSNFLRGQDVIRKGAPEQGKQRSGDGVEGLIDGGLRALSVHRLNQTGAKHVCGGEG